MADKLELQLLERVQQQLQSSGVAQVAEIAFEDQHLTLIRHYFEPAKAMSPTAAGNRAVPRRPPRNPLRVMLCGAGACEELARSDAHGLRSHRLRSPFPLDSFCRIRVNGTGQATCNHRADS
jgi:hypothetical protein